MLRKTIRGLVSCLFGGILIMTPLAGAGTEEYAEKTGLSCEACHLGASGGGELTAEGEAYLERLLTETESGQDKVTPSVWYRISKYVRFIAGFLHIFAAFFWFGTILYVHLVLKPSYAAQGLPKGEVRVGLLSMVIIGITGILLTFYRISSPSIFVETRFGILLLVKIGIFLLMVSTALVAVFFVGPRLKKRKPPPKKNAGDRLTADELKAYDGKEGRAAYFAYRGRIYDATPSGFWKDGIHFTRHLAGEDLTGSMEQAPHGDEKISLMTEIAELIPSKKGRSIYEKVFYFLAYFNLIAVILVILILALWRWW